MRIVAESDIRRIVSTIVAGVIVLAITAARAEDAPAACTSAATRACGSETTANAPPNAMRVYRDPATGAFPAPPAVTPLPPATHALSTSVENLVETPGTTAAGGVMIDLRGGFQSAITATVDDAGQVGTRCRSSADAPP